MGIIKPTGKIAIFFRTSQQYIYRKGEIILRPEDIPSGMYYVEKGFIKTYSITPDGSENIYLIFQSGDIFPGHWQFIQNGENKLFYEAISPVILHRKPKEEYESLIASDFQAAREIYESLLDIVNILAQRIENLEHTNSYARVILRLLGLASRYGREQKGKIVLNLPITHHDFARTINMSRETASRELEKLARKHLISEKDHIITIKDLQKLRNEFETFYENR